jgi:hypothetical protein
LHSKEGFHRAFPLERIKASLSRQSDSQGDAPGETAPPLIPLQQGRWVNKYLWEYLHRTPPFKVDTWLGVLKLGVP